MQFPSLYRLGSYVRNEKDLPLFLELRKPLTCSVREKEQLIYTQLLCTYG